MTNTELLLLQLKAAGLPEPTEEILFAASLGRRYRADLVYQDKKIIIEIEGGVYTKQAHGSITGILRDIEKYNIAAVLGYRVIRILPGWIQTGEAVEWIRRAL